ncbi:hypothetical protein FOZ62_027552 [Perkinsus olseni]|uniref:Uncharacterized protein n=1 Tax=Perkinsus olseni TaxID=32597 RepID=A0A7J6SDS9_PEROL|nr:hypothetical protein FOZ62_027552 [Perkinsus olseni]
MSLHHLLLALLPSLCRAAFSRKSSEKFPDNFSLLYKYNHGNTGYRSVHSFSTETGCGITEENFDSLRMGKPGNTREFRFTLDPQMGVSTTTYSHLRTGQQAHFSRANGHVEVSVTEDHRMERATGKVGDLSDDWNIVKDFFPLKHLSSASIDALKSLSPTKEDCAKAARIVIDDPPHEYLRYWDSATWIWRYHQKYAGEMKRNIEALKSKVIESIIRQRRATSRPSA